MSAASFFARLRFKSPKIRITKSRGEIDPIAVLEAILDNWDDITTATSALEENDANQVKNLINEMFPEHEQLGDILFGEKEDFKETVDELSLEDK